MFPQVCNVSTSSRHQLNSTIVSPCANGVYLDVQVNMRPIDDMESELKQRRQYTRNTSNEAYDSDSEEEGGGRGGQRVQCAQQ